MLKNPIVIDNFQKGIAQSPLFGFGKMMNVDITTIPGMAMVNYSAVKASSTNITGLPKWFVRNPNSGKIYTYTSDNKLHSSDSSWAQISGNTTTSGNGNGLAYWKDYIFVARNTAIDVYGPLSGTPAWTNSWVSLNSDTLFHPMLVGQDDILYIGNGNTIASLMENSGQTFDPATAGTYTASASALDLPSHYRVKCLAELGTTLLVGTWSGLAIYENKIADIFPWDRISSSFNLPLKIAENGVNQMMTIGNTCYITAGTNHNIYATNGTQVEMIHEQRLVNVRGGQWLNPYPGAIMTHRGKIYSGMASGSTSVTNIGVFSISQKDGINVFENQISTGTVAGTVEIGGLFSNSSDSYYIGWKDNTTYGIDLVSSAGYYASYEAIIESAMYSTGTDRNKNTFTNIEIELGDKLASGAGVVVKYRENYSDSWTTAATFDYTSYGAKRAYSFPFAVTAENIQFRMELKGSGTKLKKVTAQ